MVRLPRRDWQRYDFADVLTKTFRKPGGKQALRPIQAAVLHDLWQCGGALGPIRVGGGKTLVSLLAPAVAQAQRPLLLIPAALIEKTQRDIEVLRKEWVLPEFIRIVSYEFLGRVQGSFVLDNYRPDLIVADECHKLKNPSAAVTRRVGRYIKANRELVKFVGLSGTIAKRSIRDYSVLLDWALQGGSPAPRKWDDVVDWASALDPSDDPSDPGALIALCQDQDSKNLYVDNPQKGIRLAYQKRLVQTPGVVSSGSDTIGTSLRIRGVEVALPADMERHYRTLRGAWETPDGHPIAEATAMWRCARELACGFFYRWKVRPPSEWLVARKAWCSFVRDTLTHNRRGWDSEYQVALAASLGEIISQEYLDWTAIRDVFKPVTEAVWVHEAMLDFVTSWAKEGPGIIWTDHRAFGNRLAERGLQYFGAKATDARGLPIMHADPKKAIVASAKACSEGQNLQAWSRNLVVSADPTGRLWEQMIGRTHRDGQEADEVTVDVALACAEQVHGFAKAVEDSFFLQETTGQPYKLCYADVSVTRVDDIRTRTSAIWRK